MRHSFLAPLLSGLVLPGLGQVINRQYIKGLILMAVVTTLFFAALVKVFLDLSVVMGQVIGPDFSFSSEEYRLLLAGMRSRNLTMLYVLALVGVAVWAYGVVDAYLVGRNFRPPAGEED